MNKVHSSTSMVRISIRKEGVSFTGGIYPLHSAESAVRNFIAQGYKVVSVKQI